MPKNLEIKIKVTSLKELKNKLKKKRIGLKKILIQKDVYYSVDSGLLKLRIENGEKSLIYYQRDEKSKKRWSNYQVIKFADGDIENFCKNIFSTEINVSKVRELYIYKNTRIHLDKVKGLGSFIELETLVIDDLRNAENHFNEIVEILELDTKSQIRASYRDLLLDKKYDTDKIK
ncbi:MAG: class IV adenylate cyclase [Ignavibacterium sp.]|nr:class IV adenylate cyclase [Ignavibacterium sp.]